MKLIARIIVNSASKHTDKFFDYLIPETLQKTVTIGTRVLVPFGQGNKQIEGYVIGLSDFSKAKKLKSIISAEEIPVFDKKMLELIEWVREKYLCTYIDVIKAVIPSGTAIRNEEWYICVDENAALTPKEKKIFEEIQKHGRECEINVLMQFFDDENIKPALKRMCDKGALRVEYRDTKSVKDKIVRIVKPAIEPEDMKDTIDMLLKKRAYARARVMEALSHIDIVSVADLMMITQTNYNTISALKKAGLIEFENITVMRSHIKSDGVAKTDFPVLSMEQEYVSNKIREALKRKEFSEILLHGVTGSGKTEVFMNAIKAVTDAGKQAIILVPEISLTPQMLEHFISRFGENVSVYHSGLSLGERYDEWKKMRESKVNIVIGARSAVFAPFDNVGIIIIDEEHESTYKSEKPPRYDTKEVARFRAKQNNCIMILASATPDIGTYYRAQKKEIGYLQLKTRINKNPMPEVKIVDMRQELSSGNKSIFSATLFREIKKNIEKKEQTILFLNRRGFSTFVSCRNCGYVAVCPHCNISLTYHKYNNTLKCHYCGYERNNYTVCPSCGSKYIRYFGGGTQKVEEEVKKYFPSASTIRMDNDTTSKQNSHEKLLKEFYENKTDILIGTQMVAKGLDFPDVTLVGVISADTMLNIDDYRSAERTFDILEQVTGRAGRAKKKGRAVIQTYSPEHDAVVFASNHNYIDFYNHEISLRQVMWYPPFCDMVSILFSGPFESSVAQCARYFAKNISGIKEKYGKIQILGPIPSAITKIKNKFRWRILIKCENADMLSETLVTAAEECYKNKNYENISIVIDKNPNNMY